MEQQMKTVKCDNCLKQVEAGTIQGDNYPSDGLEIHPLTFGYYGGFLDNFPTDMDKPSGERVVFCHDCARDLFNTFPSLLKGLSDNGIEAAGGNICYGLHPCEADSPCCEFAWNSAGEEGSLMLVNPQTKEWQKVALSPEA
jgi:hypothetical protein